MQIRIPNDTEAAKDFYNLVDYGTLYRHGNRRYWAEDIARIALFKYTIYTGSDYTENTGIPVEKIAFEVRVHAQFYYGGIFQNNTDITDISPYEGKWGVASVVHPQWWIDRLYELGDR